MDFQGLSEYLGTRRCRGGRGDWGGMGGNLTEYQLAEEGLQSSAVFYINLGCRKSGVQGQRGLYISLIYLYKGLYRSL